MIAANGVSARFLEDRGWPTLQRIVRLPEWWDRIGNVADGFNDRLPDAPDSKALAEFMTRRRQVTPFRFPNSSVGCW